MVMVMRGDLRVAFEANPTCLRCEQTDRLILWAFTTDFDGKVTIWGCRRCGVAHMFTDGIRPPDEYDDFEDED